MKGRTILIINYFILIFLIIGFGLLFPGMIAFTGTVMGLAISSLFLIIPIAALFFAIHNLRLHGWQLQQFGIFDRIINYTPVFQIISLLLILIFIIIKS